MPHIKKPFMKLGVLCYKCGKEIEHGTLNWSYNTHSRGAFAHADCFASNSPVSIPVSPAAPNPQETKLPDAPTPPDAPTREAIADITDLISINNKHKATKWIKTILRHRKYPFLHGSPGAGKTHLILSLAAEMKLPSLLVTCATDMLKSELLGTKSPLNFLYSASKFRQLWQNGGLVLFDECGLAPGAFLNLLNSAMEQKIIDFPDGEQIPMHRDFFMCFADNSTLYGNDPLFPERMDVGGAFRDRLTYVDFGYDTDIEALVIAMRFEGDVRKALDWHKKVLCLRSELSKLDVPVFASPRFAYASAVWMQAGVDMETIVKAELLRGVATDIVNIARPSIERCLGVRLA